MKRNKQIVYILIIISALVFLVCCGHTGPSETLITEFQQLKVGDKVSFGSYNNESVEWIVVANAGNKLLLLSDRVIEEKPYDEVQTECTWATCELHRWLNEDFYTSAFSDEEKTVILDTTVTADPNPSYDVDCGEETNDKVFLFSIQEAKKYLPNLELRKSLATDILAKTSKNLTDGYAGWWLRTPGENQETVSYVYTDGEISDIGTDPLLKIGVRPAMWITLGEDSIETDEEILKVEADPLTEKDFILGGDAEDYYEDGNVLNEINKDHFTYQYIFYNPTVDKSKEGVITTARGIVLGSTKGDVVSAYGEGIEADFDPSTDIIYTTLDNTAEGNLSGEEIKGFLITNCSSSIKYIMPDTDFGIIFYFDYNDEVNLITFINMDKR